MSVVALHDEMNANNRASFCHLFVPCSKSHVLTNDHPTPFLFDCQTKQTTHAHTRTHTTESKLETLQALLQKGAPAEVKPEDAPDVGAAVVEESDTTFMELDPVGNDGDEEEDDNDVVAEIDDEIVAETEEDTVEAEAPAPEEEKPKEAAVKVKLPRGLPVIINRVNEPDVVKDRSWGAGTGGITVPPMRGPRIQLTPAQALEKLMGLDLAAINRGNPADVVQDRKAKQSKLPSNLVVPNPLPVTPSEPVKDSRAAPEEPRPVRAPGHEAKAPEEKSPEAETPKARNPKVTKSVIEALEALAGDSLKDIPNIPGTEVPDQTAGAVEAKLPQVAKSVPEVAEKVEPVKAKSHKAAPAAAMALPKLWQATKQWAAAQQVGTKQEAASSQASVLLAEEPRGWAAVRQWAVEKGTLPAPVTVKPPVTVKIPKPAVAWTGLGEDVGDEPLASALQRIQGVLQEREATAVPIPDESVPASTPVASEAPPQAPPQTRKLPGAPLRPDNSCLPNAPLRPLPLIRAPPNAVARRPVPYTGMQPDEVIPPAATQNPTTRRAPVKVDSPPVRAVKVDPPPAPAAEAMTAPPAPVVESQVVEPETVAPAPVAAIKEEEKSSPPPEPVEVEKSAPDALAIVESADNVPPPVPIMPDKKDVDLDIRFRARTSLIRDPAAERPRLVKVPMVDEHGPLFASDSKDIPHFSADGSGSLILPMFDPKAPLSPGPAVPTDMLSGARKWANESREGR